MVGRRKFLGYLGGVFLFLIFLVFFENKPVRIDLTQDNRYSLKPATRAILDNIKLDSKNGPIQITVYLDGDMPASFKRLQQATRSLLLDYKRLSNQAIQFRFVDPLADLSVEDQEQVIANLAKGGIKPIQIHLTTSSGITQKLIFPMALIDDGKSIIPVNLLTKVAGQASKYEDNISASIEQLEYSFGSRLQALISQSFPQIGFTEGHGEPDNLSLYDAIQSLGERYYVGRVDLAQINKSGLDSLKVLVIANPVNAFTELEKYKLNYFIQKGGRVIWALDQVDVNLSDLQSGEGKIILSRDLNLDDMLFDYGVRISSNLVSDLNAASIPVTSGVPGQNSIEMLPWVYFPVAYPDTSHVLGKKIDVLKMQFVSSLDTLANPLVKKRVVLKTAGNSRIIQTPFPLSLQVLGKPINENEFQTDAQPVAVLMEGKFKSTFQFRAIPEGITEYLPVSEQSIDTKMLVIADGDIFSNEVNESNQIPYPLGFDRYAEINYGNKAFLLNVVDYFALDNPLLELRNKAITLRLVDKEKVKSSKLYWQAISLGIPMLMLIILAIYQHYSRMYRYAK